MIRIEIIWKTIILTSAMIIFILGGCGQANGQITPVRETMQHYSVLDDTTPSLRSSPQETVTTKSSVVPSRVPSKITPPNETPRGIFKPDIESIIADLADRLNADPGDIVVLDVAPDEFPAGDLGCPQPGETPRPIPAIVTGRRVVLAHENQNYIYHIHGQQVVFCGSE